MDEVVVHPQTLALGILQETDDKAFKLIGIPLQFDGVRPPQRTASPALGEHTKEILGD
jgi:crotonobetainyl-CoA:carnitine CoA-transferase CaiB-like acyl-CoA transferase